MTYSTDFRKKVLLVTKFHLVMLGGYLNAPRLSPLVLGKRSLQGRHYRAELGNEQNDVNPDNKYNR
ncbi:hypothetical protein [Beggiatoa leptomitoformis]|uniref:Uncharacterized protein n=1 Tax=Beggiatoa leptomitoformis TaxID=288004 RepID=A0A2N9YHA2_9GAMM|nr:hypothetical protein [Beggiatoa leptomitoformis]ALG67947.1 hypothetical protein AL038_09790 [Beggiatoa leptomitoformis]AUI69779.1 hypothetical protein BLE401_14490 [Beggiatoa leptomitoformis]